MTNTRTLAMDTRSPGNARIAATAVVYLSAFAQGLTLVSFPASSSVLKALHGFSDAQYGAIFLPQVALAVAGGLAGAHLAHRLGLKALLCLALLANAGSQALLAASALFSPGLAYAVVLTATAMLGLGFGLGGAPLNTYPPLLFPRRSNSAIVAMHTMIGFGLMVGPLLAAQWSNAWLGFPVSLLGLTAALALFAGRVALPDADAPSQNANSQGTPQRESAFWLFVAIAVLYAFAEGTFSNWIVIYLQESKRLPETIAAAALSVFWGALVAGRLLVSLLVLRVRAERIWSALPALMILAFALLPAIEEGVSGLALFALAGLACSAFFPLTIALASRRFESNPAWVSSMLTAALMLGVGLGSFAVGALREALSLENLYRLSALYPVLALALIALVLRRKRAS